MKWKISTWKNRPSQLKASERLLDYVRHLQCCVGKRQGWSSIHRRPAQHIHGARDLSCYVLAHVGQ